MKSDTSKESYNTIGLEDDKVVIGASKNSSEDSKNDIKEDIITGAKNLSSGLVDKFKNFVKLGKNLDAEKSETDKSSDKSIDKSIEVSSSGENKINSCKDKLIKKLQDNLEVEKSYQVFFILLIIGLGLICLSLPFLTVLIVSPYKFVLCFSLGSLIILISFIFIYGTKSYFEILFSKHRFLFTIIFLSSILLGISFAWSNYYIFSILCSVFQLISLIVFTLSFIPGGKSGISFIGRMIRSPFANLWMRIRGQSYLPS